MSAWLINEGPHIAQPHTDGAAAIGLQQEVQALAVRDLPAREWPPAPTRRRRRYRRYAGLGRRRERHWRRRIAAKAFAKDVFMTAIQRPGGAGPRAQGLRGQPPARFPRPRKRRRRSGLRVPQITCAGCRRRGPSTWFARRRTRTRGPNPVPAAGRSQPHGRYMRSEGPHGSRQARRRPCSASCGTASWPRNPRSLNSG
jgi:hypothetical protein